ncbi:hypothetical protein ACGFX4_36140 [Kitasatospora sp. NPDC048365]|uniref:hypothetical protein n=1 Tax=Kitasatospora sp. NPDC048365 TaxID=3364050 RepID=UPI003710BB68
MRRYRSVLAVCVLLAGLSLALLSNGRDGFWWAALNELALFAAAGIAIPFYYDLFLRDAERQRFLDEMTTLLDDRLDTGQRIRVRAEGRPGPAEKAEFQREARSEIIEIGVALRSLVSLYVSRPEEDYAGPVRRLLSRGVDITYIVADPGSDLLAAYATSIGDPDLPALAAHSVRQLTDIAQRFAAEGHPGKIAVRITGHLPTGYLNIVDPDADTGRCRVSPYLAGLRRADSPVSDILRADHPELFARYAAHARTVLADSRPA